MMRPIAYDYRAATYCPDCIVAEMCWNPIEERSATELVLDDIAYIAGINRHDERTFDSSDFPKVLFAVEPGWECDRCGDVLADPLADADQDRADAAEEAQIAKLPRPIPPCVWDDDGWLTRVAVHDLIDRRSRYWSTK